MSPLAPSLVHEFEAALAWWQMAGVDCDFADDATTWLAEPRADTASPETRGPPAGRSTAAPPLSPPQDNVARRSAALPAAPDLPLQPRRNLLGDSPPADLSSFRQWWMETPGLAPSPAFPRIPPRGEKGAALMVLVPQPEAGDSERLLSGPQGRLLDAILAAMGLAGSDVYIAAALPSHTPMADLPMLAAEGWDAVTAHHIALAAPARLIAFGTGLAPMLGTKAGHPLREINHGGGKVPASLSETLDALMEMPRLKARFWRRWMEWSATH